MADKDKKQDDKKKSEKPKVDREALKLLQEQKEKQQKLNQTVRK